MGKILIVIDMQNDFIDGALGTPEAVKIVDNVRKKIEDFDGEVFYTRDTHYENYLSTQEGRNLPIVHCIEGTPGWNIRAEIDALRKKPAIDKPGFGSRELLDILSTKDQIESIEFVGLCTDICVIVISMMIKGIFPEIPLIVDAACCAGVTPEGHKNALEAMKICQIKIINE